MNASLTRSHRKIAYFSMEIAIDDRIPTYAGGLGILAGDMLRSCADLGIHVVAVTMLWRSGYFEQQLDADGAQTERPTSWKPEVLLTELPTRVQVEIERRSVSVRAFQHEIVGASGRTVPILFLDTDLPENTADDRRLSDALYGGDEKHRLAQEIVLGIGGIRALRASGYDGVTRVHLNEGHAALAALEILRETHGSNEAEWSLEAVRERCVFTTHTPIPAGHDRFDWGLVRSVLGNPIPRDVFTALAGRERMNMTLLASNSSHYINGVARKHREVSEHMFPGRDIRYITNGVHSVTWTSEPFRALYDKHIPEWRDDPAMLRKAMVIPPDHVRDAHTAAKATLLDLVRARTGRMLDPRRLTLGFARRATSYKRLDLVFRDLERLRAVGRGNLQLIFAGKAHPRDLEGKALIRHVFAAARKLGDDVPVVYLPNYDIELAKKLVAGVDVWLNTPLPPLEASGTSGMKAAHNGVPSLSILDGWWLEGCIEGLTGWAIGGPDERSHVVGDGSEADAKSLYDQLEGAVLPAFRGDRWISVVQHTIALNASFFNTHRMVQQYVTNAYLD